MVALVWLFTGCAHTVDNSVQVPRAAATQPASEPAVESEPLPEHLFYPLDAAKPNGDQIITRPHLEALVAHVVRERGEFRKQIADALAREKMADDERDIANANAAQSAWKTTWVPILTGVGGAAFAGVVETVVVWALGLLHHEPQPVKR